MASIGLSSTGITMVPVTKTIVKKLKMIGLKILKAREKKAKYMIENRIYHV